MGFWDATRQEVIDHIQTIMAEHPGTDWTSAAQAAAMNRGINELELIEDFREHFEGDAMKRAQAKNQNWN